MRCVHEAQLHRHNSFITLTYNEDKLPIHGSLRKDDLQKFFKRLRHHRGAFRYYACGEYGDRTNRAHYHACIFGLDFHDRTPFRKIGDHTLYLSQELTEIWGHGNTSVGELSYETAAYTARYVTKKLSKGQSRYNRLDSETGELIPLVQPFAIMSLRPAIAKQWLVQNHRDIYSHEKDFIVMRGGKKLKPTKYYDTLYDTINNDHMEHIKHLRQQKHESETREQIRARASITRARITQRKQI